MKTFFLLLIFPLALSALTLIEEMDASEAGDYLVTYQNRTYTMLLVRDKTDEAITFEEISVPRRKGGGPGSPWPQWLKQGAPCHTSWVTYTIDLDTAKVHDTYSFSNKGWLETNDSHFLTTLLTLNFDTVPKEQRKTTGRGNATWNPVLAFEGRKYRDIPFHAYKACWPRDGSQLAGKQITIYTPAKQGPYPGHFPYWIEVTPAPIDQKIRVVDSGRIQVK